MAVSSRIANKTIVIDNNSQGLVVKLSSPISYNYVRAIIWLDIENEP